MKTKSLLSSRCNAFDASTFQRCNASLLLLAVLILYSTFGIRHSAFGQSTAFTYQGRLFDGTNAATGLYDLQFTLRDARTGGGALAGTNTLAAVPVTNGLFTVLLDFGSAAFSGPDRWLEIAVRPAGSGPFTRLTPRQELTRAPYAIQAVSAASLLGTLPDTQLSPNIPRLDGNNTITGTMNFRPSTGAPFSVGNNDKKVASLNADKLDGLDSTNFVLKAGDTMTGPLNLPTDGLIAGGSQLVLSGGNVGIGTMGPGAKLEIDATRTDIPGGQFLTFGHLAKAGFRIDTFNAFNIDLYNGASWINPLTIQQNTGNVGIGTTTPRGNLTVANTLSHGELFVINSSSSASDNLGGYLLLGKLGAVPDNGKVMGGILFEAKTTDGRTHVADILSSVTDGATTRNAMTGDLRFGTKPSGQDDPVTRMTIDKTGNVGIGTIAPTTKLQVIGPDAVAETGWKSEFFSGYAGNYLSQRVGFGYDASGSTYGAAIMTEGTTRLWAGNDGNVGIGTSNPRWKLHVSQPTEPELNTLVLETRGQSVEGAANRISFRTGTMQDSATRDIASIAAINSNAGSHHGSLAFSTMSATILAERLRIASDGNVGIGTANPTEEKLQVAGGIMTEGAVPRFVLKSTAAGGQQYEWLNGYGESGSGVLALYNRTANNVPITFTPSGNVGIGTGTGIPGSKLEVAGTVTCTTLVQTSDRNVKEHFAAVEGRDVLERLARVPIQTWNYTNDTAKVRHIGPTAQDFHAAFAVGADDKHIATVDADGVALAAIQGLQEIVKEKDAEIQELKKSVGELRTLFTALSEKVRSQ